LIATLVSDDHDDHVLQLVDDRTGEVAWRQKLENVAADGVDQASILLSSILA
jgi:hypothetical protein